ncbi:hypothetical protein R1sor_014961 [Riccia sorocarpa]|uniref:UBA domain-containing protein n=1 Tax=Riccia sorocarpa TaxID=122646 RepID=A0ABD3HAV8_9MARC
MEAVAAIGTLATLYSIIKGIFKLQEKVVKYKEDVDEFVSFIRATETLLLREESLLRDYQQGHGTLPEPVAALLGKFEIYLLQSKDLLEKLTFYSPITEFDAPNQMKRLRQDIQDVKLEMVLAMVFNAGSRQRVQQTAQAFQQAPARESVHSQPHSQTTYQDQDSQGKISRLMVLGFDKESVTQALELCGGDKEQAATYLFELQDTSLTVKFPASLSISLVSNAFPVLPTNFHYVCLSR